MYKVHVNVLLCLVVCLTLLASFFLPSHISLKHVPPTISPLPSPPSPPPPPPLPPLFLSAVIQTIERDFNLQPATQSRVIIGYTTTAGYRLSSSKSGGTACCSLVGLLEAARKCYNSKASENGGIGEIGRDKGKEGGGEGCKGGSESAEGRERGGGEGGERGGGKGEEGGGEGCKGGSESAEGEERGGGEGEERGGGEGKGRSEWEEGEERGGGGQKGRRTGRDGIFELLVLIRGETTQHRFARCSLLH